MKFNIYNFDLGKDYFQTQKTIFFKIIFNVLKIKSLFMNYLGGSSALGSLIDNTSMIKKKKVYLKKQVKTIRDCLILVFANLENTIFVTYKQLSLSKFSIFGVY